MSRQRFMIFDNKPFGLRAGGIVLRDDQILLMRRVKAGREYYVFPGGGVDPGETIQQAIAREIFEETNQIVTVTHIAYHLDFIDDSDQYFGLCQWTGGGEVKLNGEECERHCPENQYQPLWLPIQDLANLNILPPVICDWLLADMTQIQAQTYPNRHLRMAFER